MNIGYPTMYSKITEGNKGSPNFRMTQNHMKQVTRVLYVIFHIEDISEKQLKFKESIRI